MSSVKIMVQTISEIVALWSRILEKAKVKLNDQRVFDSFLSDSYIHHIDNQTMYVAVNSGFAAEILGSKYQTMLDESVQEATGTNFKLVFIEKAKITQTNEIKPSAPTFFADAALNSAYTFKTFVVGPSNREAYQASLMVARNPGQLYNPLLIFSDSGLGKTHLLHAIGNSIKESHPTARVLYVTAADFVDEYIKYAHGEKEGDSLQTFFKNSVDVFLVDDIQFLVGKRGTMEMFFVVFCALVNQGKQIVITSDQHPNKLDGLDERLKTRFIQGLTIDIKKPDVTTSEEILKMKIEANNLDVNDFDGDVLSFFANRFSSSVRELEEALNRLLFYTINIKPTKHITLQTAMEAISGLIDVQDDQTKLSESRIIAVVADYYNLTPSQLTGKIRTSQIALARHIAMYLIRTLLDVPFTKIGMLFGGKDHATVMNGVQKVENEVKTNPATQKAISDLKSKLTK